MNFSSRIPDQLEVDTKLKYSIYWCSIPN
jgi:hypothetical protein